MSNHRLGYCTVEKDERRFMSTEDGHWLCVSCNFRTTSKLLDEKEEKFKNE